MATIKLAYVSLSYPCKTYILPSALNFSIFYSQREMGTSVGITYMNSSQQ